MKKIIYIIFLIFIFSCKNKNISNIIIKYDKSSAINLFKGKITIRYLEKKDSIYNFKISDKEIDMIRQIYINQNISKYESKTLIVDSKPIIMPATDIKYIISFNDSTEQEFIIRTDFRSNPLSTGQFKNFKVFIEKIDSIIKLEKEFKGIIKSDYIYM